MEEADRCSRLAIMARGGLLACDTPAAMKERIGGDVITVTSSQPAALRQALRDRLGVEAAEVDGSLRLERDRGHEFVPRIIEAAPGLVEFGLRRKADARGRLHPAHRPALRRRRTGARRRSPWPLIFTSLPGRARTDNCRGRPHLPIRHLSITFRMVWGGTRREALHEDRIIGRD